MNFIVKLFPEITIKSQPVRRRLTRMLTDNMRVLLKRIHPKVSVKKDWDKLEVFVPDEPAGLAEAVADALSRVSGIANFASVRTVPITDLESIYAEVAPLWVDKLAGKTFCVRVKRNGDHAFSSSDVERYVGGRLNQDSQALGVRLKNPDLTVKLEVREDTLYLVDRVYPGQGGFPMGSQGSVISMVSGGFDSTVASYLCMKRGLRTHFLFFNLGGKAHEFAVKEIAYYLWQRYSSGHRVKFITVPFEGMVADILENVDPSCMGVVLKRMMLRCAEQIADKAKSGALVTGEAVAQVSSQTLTNLSIIDRAVSCLILRPLALMDKRDIIDTCRAIGAEDFSASVPEYCGVISVRPSASVRMHKVLAEEAKMDADVLAQALAATKLQNIDAVMADLDQDALAIATVAHPGPEHKIIDIRHPNERDLRPLVLPGNDVIDIPFYSLDKAFADLDTRFTYLLYCDKGVMSQLHAAHLSDSGASNIGVYRPE